MTCSKQNVAPLSLFNTQWEVNHTAFNLYWHYWQPVFVYCCVWMNTVHKLSACAWGLCWLAVRKYSPEEQRLIGGRKYNSSRTVNQGSGSSSLNRDQVSECLESFLKMVEKCWTTPSSSPPARHDSPQSPPQLWHESRSRPQLPLQLRHPPAEVRRQEGPPHVHEEERWVTFTFSLHASFRLDHSVCHGPWPLRPWGICFSGINTLINIMSRLGQDDPSPSR